MNSITLTTLVLCSLCLWRVTDSAYERYHKILGLKPGATLAQIKQAYMHLAQKYDTDKNIAALEKFSIFEAYGVLIRYAEQTNRRCFKSKQSKQKGQTNDQKENTGRNSDSSKDDNKHQNTGRKGEEWKRDDFNEKHKENDNFHENFRELQHGPTHDKYSKTANDDNTYEKYKNSLINKQWVQDSFKEFSNTAFQMIFEIIGSIICVQCVLIAIERLIVMLYNSKMLRILCFVVRVTIIFVRCVSIAFTFLCQLICIVKMLCIICFVVLAIGTLYSSENLEMLDSFFFFARK